MEKKSIFRQESINRVLSPEQLDEYIRVSNPGIWLVLIAFIILSASVVVWGFTGTLPKTLTVNGIVNENEGIVCFVDANKLSKDITGCKVQIATAGNSSYDGLVTGVSAIPYSAEEIANSYESDWIIRKLVTDDYAYAVNVSLSDTLAYAGENIVSVTLIIEEIKPISYLLN